MYLFQTKGGTGKRALLQAARLGTHSYGPDEKIRLPISFPIILNSNGTLNASSFKFLLDLKRSGRSHNRTKTLQTYAESLFSWFQFLETRELDWQRPMPIYLSDYRFAMANGEGPSRKKCATATITLRSTVVKEFYKFIRHSKPDGDGGCDPPNHGDPDIFVIQNFLEVASRVKSRSKSRRLGRALTEEQVARIARYLPSPHSLIFKWTLATGLRRTDAVELKIDQLPENNLSLNYMEVLVKGGKTIFVPVTSALTELTSRYIAEERMIASSKGGYKSRALFLNNRGIAMTSLAYYRAFNRACKAAGINASPHMARHTFAARAFGMLDKLATEGHPVNPIKLLQQWLGHSEVGTTEIYLNSIAALDRVLINGLSKIQRMAL